MPNDLIPNEDGVRPQAHLGSDPAADRLTLRTLRVRAVEVPLARPLLTASGAIRTAPLVLVDLATEQGVVGSSYVFAYTPLALRPLATLLENLGAALEGRSVAPIPLEAELAQRFRLLGPQGLTGMAMAALDMAAWDAQARAAQLPLVRLLGGTPRSLRAYNSLGMDGAEAAGRLAAESAELGFHALKIKVGYPDVRTDVEAVRAVRRETGDRLALMVDYNQSLDVPEAIRRTRILDDEGLAWVEEPTRADDFEGHARIARAVRTPLSIGENWWGTSDMAKSLAAGASSFGMPDAMKIGGVTGWLRAAALGQASGVPLSSHVFPEISAHLLAITPTCHWLEYLDLARPVLRTPVAVKDGHVTAADAPGSGIEFDDAAVERYRAR
jgi:mandelate racemase